MNTSEDKSISLFHDLVELMRKLRSKNECPWDKEQSHWVSKTTSRRRGLRGHRCNIDSGDPDKLKKELAGLFFHIIFHCQIAKEKGEFDIGGVIFSLPSFDFLRRILHVFFTFLYSNYWPDYTRPIFSLLRDSRLSRCSRRQRRRYA